MTSTLDARGRGETGSAAVEVAMLAPVFLALISFVVFVGRIGSLGQNTASAARDAARAASIHSAAPDGWAIDAATTTLSDSQVSCRDLMVDVDSSRSEPGGSVTVTVTCTVEVRDLTGLPLPGAKSVSSSSVAVIDRYATPRP